MFGWPEVQIARCPDRRMAEWPDVWMARCPDGQKSKWPQGELARRIVGQKARNLDDYMVYIEYIKQIPKYWCSLGTAYMRQLNLPPLI